MKGNKLEILVVEDTPENLAVAREYFNSQKDLVVDYATYRDEAISMLDNKKYDGVITDKSIPKTKDGKIVTYEDLDHNFGLINFNENNGWIVALTAEIKEIPWVMHTDHGASMYVFPSVYYSEAVKKENFQKILETYSNYSIEEIKLMMKKDYEWPSIIPEALNILGKEGRVLDKSNFTKKDLGSWTTALTYLKERIEPRN